jgi:hypothetical protein
VLFFMERPLFVLPRRCTGPEKRFTRQTPFLTVRF